MGPARAAARRAHALPTRKGLMYMNCEGRVHFAAGTRPSLATLIVSPPRRRLRKSMAAHALLQLTFVRRKTGCSSATFGAFPR